MVIGYSITVRSVQERAMVVLLLRGVPEIGEVVFEWYDIVLLVTF